VQRIVAGEGTPQIAETLVIRQHAVEADVRNILCKLELATRLQIAVWLWKHDLVERDSPADGIPGLTKSSIL
jgi:DNA-binding NarL/FixJ family response regulator